MKTPPLQRLPQLLQEGVEKDLKIAALQEPCEELLDAHRDEGRDLGDPNDKNAQPRQPPDLLAAAERVQLARRECRCYGRRRDAPPAAGAH